MGCNCKIINKGDDFATGLINSSKMSFFTKLKVSFNFIEFYFYFVATSVFNLIFNDRLEPKIPERIIKKYEKY